MWLKVKPYLKWIILTVIIILLVLVVLSQNTKVISATVSPEVIVKGQPTEVMVTAVVKPSWFSMPIMFVQLVGPGKMYNTFTGQAQFLGFLHKIGKDASDNSVYQGKFRINYPTSETVQIRLKKPLLTLAYPNEEVYKNDVYPRQFTWPTLRLAVSTRYFTLPPDPGEAGKITLEGTDSDNDGLRDDIQREIFFNYPESERLRMAMRQIWMAKEKLLVNMSNKEVLQKVFVKNFQAENCIRNLLTINNVDQTKIKEYNDKMGYISTISQNTIARRKASIMAGEVGLGHEGILYKDTIVTDQACTFDWQSLPD